MSKWINNKERIWKHMVKPCRILGLCPYGQLVEEFPLKQRRNKFSCTEFGHDCPAFYHTEFWCEDKKVTKKEVEAMEKEIDQYMEKEVK